MTNDLFQAIQTKAKAYEHDISEFLIKMVRVPSLSRQEKDVIQVIKNEMEIIGFDEIRIDGLGSIIGRIGNGPRVIAFDAHIDTVDTGELSLWKTDPFDAQIKDRKVIGRGTVDQKGGMGPGNEAYTHAPNEATPIEHLSQACAFYAAYVARLNQ